MYEYSMWRTKIGQISKADCRRSLHNVEECNAEEWATALIKVESWLQTPNQGRPPSDWGLLVEGSWGNAEQHEGWHTSKVTHWNKIPSQGKNHRQRPCLSYWHFKDYLQHLQREIVWWENTAFNPATPSVAVLLITSVKVPSVGKRRHYWSGLINPNTATHHDFTLASVNWSNQGW